MGTQEFVPSQGECMTRLSVLGKKRVAAIFDLAIYRQTLGYSWKIRDFESRILEIEKEIEFLRIAVAHYSQVYTPFDDSRYCKGHLDRQSAVFDTWDMETRKKRRCYVEDIHSLDGIEFIHAKPRFIEHDIELCDSEWWQKCLEDF